MQLTITDISEELGIKRHRVAYALRTRGVEPERRIGSTDVYAEEAVELVLEALADNMLGRTNPAIPVVLA